MYGPNHPERIKLNNQIRDWNSNRLDLFEISEPNEYLEFYGVMRFFYQGDDLKYQTKCLRVSSTATTLDLIEAVVIKFHPDLKMLSNDRYALYESHNMQDRKMKDNEHPLIVQLNWAYDDKDGKFILKNESRRRRSTDLTSHAMLNNYGMSKSTSALGNVYDSQTLRSQSSAVYSTSSNNFFSKRMLSSKKSKRKSKGKDSIQDAEEAQRLAAELSGKPPESSFTRTISNPDEVMKRRRQRKLESRLEQFSGDNETGGTLKIYGDSINSDIPYKTLLLSVNDTTEKVLTETLDKYGLTQEDHRFYLLVQQNIPPKSDRIRGEVPEEIILHDQDCPLGILVHCPPKRGNATFAVRRRTPMDKIPIKPRMPPFSISSETLVKSPGQNRSKPRESNSNKHVPQSMDSVTEPEHVTDYPRLLKLLVDHDGSLYHEDDIYSLSSLVIDHSKDLSPIEGSRFIKIGSQQSAVGSYPNILLPQDYYVDIRPTHCHISAKLDPQSHSIKCTLTPTLDSTSRIPKPCLVFINEQKIEKPTRLRNEDIIQIGDSVLFKFEDNENEQQNSINDVSNSISDNLAINNSIDSVHMYYLTADLPVSVVHSYTLSEEIIDRIFQLSKDYAENGSKDLFSCNSDPRYPDLDELFRLSPAYLLYLVLRSGLGKEQHVSHLKNVILQNIEQVIQEDKKSVEKEVFWLSNISEFLHLLQCDNDLRHYSDSAQDVLASAIEQSFSILQSQFSQDLMILLPAFIDPDDSDLNDDTREDTSPCLDRASILVTYGEIDYPIQHLLQTLSLAYTLFHNCQVNVALTIQMFSQLFHLLNTWLFNAVLGDPSDAAIEPLPVSPEWGARLSRRLSRIRNWSETNGLDVAANCHLQKMYQVAELMEADKRDLNIFGEKCLELININGNQLHFLLENCEDYELPTAWIEVVVNTAIQWHDQAFNVGVSQNKKDLPLHEDLNLRLPLLLPADGYCCDRGIVSCPKDLRNMLNSLNGYLSYKLNLPTLNQVDTRWKTYLGPYENTPSVSRSGTLVEQSSQVSIKNTTQPGLPRNMIHDDRDNNLTPETRFPSHSSKRPTDLPLENHRSQSSDSSDKSENSEILKGDLKNRYKVKLKKINNSLGLSIIAARKSPSDIFRIYIKEVIPGGAGYKYGKIETGDQLVSVDGLMLEDINQEEAVEFMKKTKLTVNLLMEKGAAQRHGVLDIILKSKNLKAAAQLNQKKHPSAPAEPPRPVKIKSGTNQSKSTHRPEKSRENISMKKSSPVENENRKRTDYNLPPVPQLVKPPPRPARGPVKHRNKSQTDDADLSDQEYHSLPVRKNKSHQPHVPKIPTYATINKGRSPRDNDRSSFHSLQNKKTKPTQSGSQPNLAINYPKKRLATPISSDSSSSGTLMTSDEEEEHSFENKPPINKPRNTNRNTTSLHAKMPQLPSPQKHKTPVKTLSDNNISKGMPRYEVAPSNNLTTARSSKNKILPSPVIVPSSEPVINDDSQSNTENLNLKTPVNFQKRNNRSHSSTSESESDNSSSETQSLSSDQSPKPQRKMNSEPIVSMRQPVSLKASTSPNELDNGENPLKHIKPESNHPHLPSPVKKPEEMPSPIHPKVDSPIIIPKVNQEKPKRSIPPPKSLPIHIIPPPFPTASHPQYHPPNALEEQNWSSGSKPQPTKLPNDEEIRLRRKAIEDKIRTETEISNKKDDDISSPSDSRSQSLILPEDNKVNPNRNSARYGRPQFHDKTNRPESQYKPASDNSETNISVSLSPSSPLPKGIIVPASSVTKSPKSGANDNNQDHSRVKTPDSAEHLSFKEKLKLFAQKNGETEIVNRNKFSSKQLRIESGNYN